jgi:hypothetical protein
MAPSSSGTLRGHVNSALQHPPAVPHWVIVSSGALSLLGFAGLVLTVVLGFETLNTALLVTSGALSFALPFAAALYRIPGAPCETDVVSKTR